MEVYIQSKDCRKGDIAALEKGLASCRTCSELDLAYLLRINADFNHVDCVRFLLKKKLVTFIANNKIFCIFKTL